MYRASPFCIYWISGVVPESQALKEGTEQMKITLITVGKIKEKYLKDAIAEYSKRLSRYCKLEIIEVADEKTPDQASETVEEADQDKGRRADPANT